MTAIEHRVGTRVLIIQSLTGRIGECATILGPIEHREWRYSGQWFDVQRISIDGRGEIGPNGHSYANRPEWMIPLPDPSQFETEQHNEETTA